ncbi:hypothetical protein IFR05_012564 [Cadophora sp. M221]|nr:hypothetical protein IFR05_012564 [Cadophora sp. M221]
MGDTTELLEGNWISHDVPQALPVGEPHIHPPATPHAVSSSLPTWDAVIAWSRKEKAARENVEFSYPRFFIAKPIQSLITCIARRLQIENDEISCMVFPSPRMARFCATVLRASRPEAVIDTVRFYLPREPNNDNGENDWTDFTAVLFPAELNKESMMVWMDTGAGITTRHAEYCLKTFDFLASESLVPAYQTPPPSTPTSGYQTLNEWRQSAHRDMNDLRARIAELVTSEKLGLKRVEAEDVLIFPTGMNAIFSAFEALATLAPNSDIVAYGSVLRNLGRDTKFATYGITLLTCLSSYQVALSGNGPQSQSNILAVVVCETPSNIKFISPDLHRIRCLADKYSLIVACDETAGNFINVDVLPFVDVVLSSLTKIFSGASDVTGGSIVVNPNSRHYGKIRWQLAIQHEEVVCFPIDVVTLIRNSINMASRVRKSNVNIIPVLELFNKHPAVEQVNHPSLGPTSPWYENIMRREGGYGNVLSVVFRSPDFARRFYDSLDVCKGSSFGTNFTLAVPYVQLACYWKQDQCEKYGLPRHIIRISVGLEDSKEIVDRIESALEEADIHQSS